MLATGFDGSRAWGILWSCPAAAFRRAL